MEGQKNIPKRTLKGLEKSMFISGKKHVY